MKNTKNNNYNKDLVGGELSYQDKLLIRVLHDRIEEERLGQLNRNRQAALNSDKTKNTLNEKSREDNNDLSLYQRFILHKEGVDVCPMPSENEEIRVKLYERDLELKKAAGIIPSIMPDPSLIEKPDLKPKKDNTENTSDISSKPLDKKSSKIDFVLEQQASEPMDFGDPDL